MDATDATDGTQRPRAKPEIWRPIFLKELERTFNVGKAAKKAGVDRASAYRARHENPDFAEAWDAALETCLDGLEEAGVKRAKSHSDVLLKFFLSSRRAEFYRDQSTLRLGGTGESGAIVIEQHATPASIASFRATLGALGLGAPVPYAGEVLPPDTE